LREVDDRVAAISTEAAALVKMKLVRSAIHHLRNLNRCLDQAANMSMKIPLLGSIFGILVAAFIGAVQARDDGRYSLSPLKPWFDSLRSGKGPCCSDADGFALSDPDWESRSGHYRVRVDNEWIDVPDDAVITEPGGQDDGLAHQGTSRNLHSLFHAGQHDMSRAHSISSICSDLVRRYFDIGQRSAPLLTIQVLERVD
jgi:hypothetical protein